MAVHGLDLRPTRSAVLMVLLAIAGNPDLQAAVWNVDSTLDALDAVPGDGLCAITGSGACSLRAAIQEANFNTDADEIVIPAGVFALTLAGDNEDLSASGDLDIRAALILRGAGVEASIIDGVALDRVLDLHAPTGVIEVSLDALTLANGRSTRVFPTSVGLGLRVAANINLQMQDVDVRDNQATQAFGGGIGIDNRGCLSATRVRILRNIDPASVGSAHALAGGATTRGASSCFTLIDSEISGNSADHSGAIYTDDNASITLRRSLIADNTARFAGAMTLNQANVVLLEDVTISGNRGNPGAILVDGGALLTLRNCTVTANTASASTANVGGIHDVHGGFGRTFISNTIIADNGPGTTSDDCSNISSAGGGNLIGSILGCQANLMANDRTGIDPQLGPLTDNGGATRTHLPGPPTLDFGATAACTVTDQRGLPRPQDGDGDGNSLCDIGAVELAPVPRLFGNGFE